MIIGTLPLNIVNGQLMDAAAVMALVNFIRNEVNANASEGPDIDVSSVSMVSANGFGGSVLTPTTTPAIIVTTSVVGILLGDGTAVSAATGNDLPVMTATTRGAVPTPPNDPTKFLNGAGGFTAPAGSGGGTVTSASVATANGFAGTVANPTTTPAITVKTSVTGILLGNGTGVSAATGNDLPVMTATTRGAVPTPPNNANLWLNGAGTYTAPAGGGTVTAVAVAAANGFSAIVTNPATTPSIAISTSLTGMLKGNGTALLVATPGTDYVSPTTGDARYVRYDSPTDIQNCGANHVSLSNTGVWTNSEVSFIMDANIKAYSDFTSPAPGYLRAAVSGESRMDYNGVGGAPVGGYFSAIAHGTVGGTVDDSVGMLAQARKYTNSWQAGCHVDLFDHTAGGTSIGYNLEVPMTQAATTTIGFNMQVFPGQTAGIGVNLTGDAGGTTYGALLAASASAGAVIDLNGSSNTNYLVKFANTNNMFVNRSIGTYSNTCLAVLVDGAILRYIPLYQD